MTGARRKAEKFSDRCSQYQHCHKQQFVFWWWKCEGATQGGRVMVLQRKEEFRCFGANRGKWKGPAAVDHWKLNPGHLACAPSALPMSYDNWTTASPHIILYMYCTDGIEMPQSHTSAVAQHERSESVQRLTRNLSPSGENPRRVIFSVYT